MKNIMIGFVIAVSLLVSCGNAGEQLKTSGETESSSGKGNYMTMKIDGKEWKADLVEAGYLGEILAIGGKKGNGSTQQEFNISLTKATGAGTFTISNANASADGSKRQTSQDVAQLANLTVTNYLCGGLMQGNQLTVVITKASKSTQEVEGSFSGTMQCVEGNMIRITDGKFYYHE